jgi:hypothetical protein
VKIGYKKFGSCKRFDFVALLCYLASNRKETLMLTKEALHKDIDAMPEEFTEEIYDFVNFLKRKLIKENTEAALLSESSLRKDWLFHEEDEAWKNL